MRLVEQIQGYKIDLSGHLSGQYLKYCILWYYNPCYKHSQLRVLFCNQTAKHRNIERTSLIYFPAVLDTLGVRTD